jgi:hypothetical protein
MSADTVLGRVFLQIIGSAHDCIGNFNRYFSRLLVVVITNYNLMVFGCYAIAVVVIKYNGHYRAFSCYMYWLRWPSGLRWPPTRVTAVHSLRIITYVDPVLPVANTVHWLHARVPQHSGSVPLWRRQKIESNLKWFSKGQYSVCFWIEYLYRIEYFTHTVIMYVYIDRLTLLSTVNPVKQEEWLYVLNIRLEQNLKRISMATGRGLKIFDLNLKWFFESRTIRKTLKFSNFESNIFSKPAPSKSILLSQRVVWIFLNSLNSKLI